MKIIFTPNRKGYKFKFDEIAKRMRDEITTTLKQYPTENISFEITLRRLGANS